MFIAPTVGLPVIVMPFPVSWTWPTTLWAYPATTSSTAASRHTTPYRSLPAIIFATCTHHWHPSG